MAFKNVFTLCFLAAIPFVLGANTINLPGIPAVLRPCHRSDPRISECLKQNAVALKPYLSHGFPLLGIPSCEPLIVPEIVMEKGEGTIAVSSVYRNIHIMGVTDFEIISIEADMENELLQAKVKIPRLAITAQYAIEGKALMVPINGSGDCNGNFTNIDCDVVVQLETYTKGLEQYLRCSEVAVDLEIENGAIHFDNLFSKNGKIGRAMNKRLNENWRRVIKDLKPTIEATIEEQAKDFMNKLYGKYPLNIYLPA